MSDFPPPPPPPSPQSELRSEGLKKVGIHNLSPGMVTTDLLMAGTNTSIAK
jgi:chlorophyll(ide) b reductase